MLTLKTSVRIPAGILFSVVGEDAFLLNPNTNKYFGLEEVGTRLWHLMSEGKSLNDAYQIILTEYEVDPGILEQDILELLGQLQENGLVEVVAA